MIELALLFLSLSLCGKCEIIFILAHDEVLFRLYFSCMYRVLHNAIRFNDYNTHTVLYLHRVMSVRTSHIANVNSPGSITVGFSKHV